ncbi:response regulator [Oribacterium sp. oral taxon 102]|uniref:ATP-binding protein n=1 Tax=Oribacterium sp. oral taxon 102 TaxID=671214 RepID=UPI0015B942BE|nr:ATP-binding protein [Oribacterium sp. oral taxon 102]NWO20452.1 response regulator [Oribacterium sp. oral taxon 102]
MRIWKITERRIRYVYLSLLLMLVLFCIGSELYPYQRYGFDSGSLYELSQGWVRLLPDGREEPLRLPCRVPEDSRIVIERQLPEEAFMRGGNWIYLHSLHQDITATISGREIYRHVFQDDSLFGKGMAPGVWLRFPLPPGAAGERIRITLERSGRFVDESLGRIYYGEESAILAEIFRDNAAQLFTGILLLLLGIGTLLEHLFFHRMKSYALGFYLFFAGLWILSQSEARQFLFHNIILIRNLEFLSLLLLPVPGLLAVNEIEGSAFRKETLRLSAFLLLLELLTFGLYLFTPVDFMDLYPLIMLGLLLAAGFALFGFFRMYRRERQPFRAILGSIVAHLALITAGLLEILFLKLFGARYQGWIMVVGTVSFGLQLLLSNIRNYNRINEEKKLLEMREKTKSEFLSSMSHEMRTPINAILGMNELILRESAEDRIRSFAMDIHTAGQSLLTIVNEILEYTRLESGQNRSIEKPFCFGELLHDVITVIRIRAGQKELRFEAEIAEGLPLELLGNSFWLREIMMNLLDNAVKYTEKGAVHLTADCASEMEARLRLPFLDGRQEILRIRVQDTGIGIGREKQEAIFQRFTRDSESWNSYIQGTGLGLAITKQYVQNLGGRIELQSEPGIGSTFTAYIPMKLCSEERIGSYAAYSLRLEESRTSGMLDFTAREARILAADDNVLNLRLMRELLRPTGAELDTESSGEGALERLRAEHYDLVFLDDLMQGQRGTDILRTIRKEDIRARGGGPLPVVVFTANVMPGARENYLAQGFDAYLEKPANRDMIVRLLRELLPAALLRPMETAGETEADLAEGEEAVLDLAVGRKYCMGDEEVYREILGLFLDSYEERTGALLAAVEKADWDGYELQAHSLKTNALTVGAMQFSTEARELELAAKKCRVEAEREQAVRYILSRNQRLLVLYRGVTREIRGYLSAAESAPPEGEETRS